MVVAKVEDVWQRAVLVEMRPEGALVRLVDTDKEVTVEYRECKDLPDSLRSVPSAKVNVSLFGLESDGWNEVNAVRLLHILHLDVEVPTTPSMFIIVHSMENKVWEVSMLEEISRNHPVNIGALLVREKLAKCMMAPVSCSTAIRLSVSIMKNCSTAIRLSEIQSIKYLRESFNSIFLCGDHSRPPSWF